MSKKAVEISCLAAKTWVFRVTYVFCCLLWVASAIGLVVVDIPVKIWCDKEVKAAMESVKGFFRSL